MRRLLEKLQFHTRWQIYLRVVPALVVGTLVVAVVGLLGFSHWSREAITHAQSHQLGDMTRSIRDRALVMAAGLEALRLRDASGEAIPALVRTRGVAAAAAVALAPATARPVPALGLVDSLDTAENRAHLAHWLTENRARLQGGSAYDLPPNADPRTARAAGGPPLDMVLFAPLTLAVGEAWASPPGARVAVLPLAVRTPASAGDDDASLLVFLDLEHLAAVGKGQVDWWCLLSRSGEVLGSADGRPAVGADLGGRPDDRDVGPGISLPALAEALANSRTGDQVVSGDGPLPWIVSRHRDPDLPLVAVAATRADHLREMAVFYFVAVAGVALLAIVAAMVGVSSVVGRVSGRLAELGTNMEALARGEFDRRLPRGEADEVGRLVRYFNLMATSLDEAHRQVKEKNAHLQAALENMRLLDKAKDDFLVLISHEVRTPLTSLLGGVNYLKTSIEHAEPADREALGRLELDEIIEIIASSGDRLNGFMTDAIQMTTMQARDRQLDLAPVAAADLVESGLTCIDRRALARGIAVTDALPRDPEWLVLGDKDVLKVAFTRILDNAVVHNRDGGEIVLRETEAVPELGAAAALATPDRLHKLQEQPAWLDWSDEEVSWRIIEVHNTGPAIPPDRIKALFSKFELVERIEHHSRGSGLSLPIANAAVEHHGGRIFVRSEEGLGTSFYVLLPTVPAEARTRGGAATLWENAGDGLVGGTGHEEIDLVADAAGLEVELDDDRAGGAGGADQAGGRVDGAGGAHDQEEVTGAGRRL